LLFCDIGDGAMSACGQTTNQSQSCAWHLSMLNSSACYTQQCLNNRHGLLAISTDSVSQWIYLPMDPRHVCGR